MVFHPIGTSRRVILSYDRLCRLAGLRLVCVNRPGRFGTDLPSGSDLPKHRAFVDTFCADVAAVLQALLVGRVSILAVSTGAPFAWAFATKYPQYCTGRVLGLSCWVAKQVRLPYRHVFLFLLVHRTVSFLRVS